MSHVYVILDFPIENIHIYKCFSALPIRLRMSTESSKYGSVRSKLKKITNTNGEKFCKCTELSLKRKWEMTLLL